MTFICLVL
jgi:hypothetical protein